MNRRILSLLIFRAILFCLFALLQVLGPLVGIAGFPFQLFVLLSVVVTLINWGGFLLIKYEMLEGMYQYLFVWTQIIADILLVGVFVFYFQKEFEAAPIFFVFIVTMSTLFFSRVYVYLVTILVFIANFLLTVPGWRGNNGGISWWSGGADIETVKVSGGYFIVFFTVALLGNYLRSIFDKNYLTIRDQKRQIKRLESIRRNIVESLSSGLITVDQKNRVTYANPAAYLLLERDGSLDGLAIGDLFPVEFGGTSSGNRQRIECIVQVGSRKKTFGLALTPFDWSDKEPGNLILFQDLTRIKQLEDQQKISSKMAAIGKVAAGVAHEIRNPLAALSGSVQVIASLVPENPTIDELMEIVQKETSRLNHIIDQFLSYSKPLNAVGFKAVNLKEVIQTFLRLAQNDSLIGAYKLAFNCSSDEAWILGHSEQVIQVLWNLLRNSCQASKTGERIDIELYSDNESACLIIKDFGEGISEEAKQHLFTPFQRFRKGPGLGLGLSIVYEIVQLHGGTIDVNSEEGHGSEFHLRFPLTSKKG